MPGTGNKQFISREPSGIRLGIFYTLYLLLIGAVVFRMVPHYLGTPSGWAVLALLAGYLILFLLERVIRKQRELFLSGIFIVELVIIFILLVIPSDTSPKDYFINLVLPLCGHAAWNFPDRISRRWIFIFCLFCLASMLGYYGNSEGVSFGLTYVVGCLLISVLISVTLHADRARLESQQLLEELKATHQQLAEYAQKVEVLAAAEERNRLARELHDSVSQIIFSINLTSQSARILLQKDPSQVPAALDHLQALSQNALAEMRSLIQQLRPNMVAQDGLVAAVRNHISERLAMDGLEVALHIEGDCQLSRDVENSLFRLIQEALNNVVKHAGTGEATVHLCFEGEYGSVTIEDHGRGFDLATASSQPGHMGFLGMEERVRSFGGQMKVESSQGNGTRVLIDHIPLISGRAPGS